MPRRRPSAAQLAAGLLLLALAGRLAALAAWSLEWRYAHDTPLLLYAGFLMDRFGAVPYRDFFDMNLPGSYLFYGAIVRTLGTGDFGVRAVDLACLAGLAALAALALRGFGPAAAGAAGVLFGSRYLLFGPKTLLQRDYVLLLPVLAGVVAAVSLPRRSVGLRAALAGLCFGAATTVKPQAAVGLPVVWLYLCWERPAGHPAPRPRARLASGLALAGCAAAGFAVAPLAAVAYLARNDALAPFLDWSANYLPLYSQLNYSHRVLAPGERGAYPMRGLATFGGHGVWLLAAGAGVGAVVASRTLPSRLRRRGALLGGLLVAYWIYPALSGQFWDYHWLPFLFFAALAGALCFARPPPGAGPLRSAAPLLAALVVVATALDPLGDFRERGPFEDPTAPPRFGAPDRIAAYLRTHLEPGDTVQPLDWAGGAVHGMLLAGARIATPWLYVFHFYHHVSHPFIRRIRRDFVRDLARARPRFLVDGRTPDNALSGPDTARRFPELDALLAGAYRPLRIASGPGYLLWERREDAVWPEPSTSEEDAGGPETAVPEADARRSQARQPSSSSAPASR